MGPAAGIVGSEQHGPSQMGGHVGYRGVHVGAGQVLGCGIPLVNEQRVDARASDGRKGAGNVHGSGLNGLTVDRLVRHTGKRVRHARPAAWGGDSGNDGDLHGGYDGTQRFDDQCPTAVVVEQRSQWAPAASLAGGCRDEGGRAGSVAPSASHIDECGIGCEQGYIAAEVRGKCASILPGDRAPSE